MLRWYLVRTKPNAEATARVNLDRQGYEVYFPRLAQSLPSRGRWLERVVPLFPGYLFLRLDEGRQPLAPVRSTLGVSCAVRFGPCYAIVPDDVIRELRARANPETGMHRLKLPARLAPGARVRILAGPFDGLEGIFQRESGSDRAIVLLTVLGQTASVGVPVGNVVPRHAA
ncbi:MAG: transcription termination/antitermination NusG family protein [Steroidobacteraceae bacterium]